MLSSNNAAADINNNNALPSNIAAPIKSMAQRILVADDYEQIRQALHDVLAVSFPECDIVAASTAEEAVCLAKLHAPAVVVMDLRIPEMNGIAATRLIKQALPETKVVMCSQDEVFQAEAGAAGASAYVYKREIHKVLVPLLTDLLRQAS